MGQGTFDEMSTSGVDFSTLLKRDKEEDPEIVYEYEGSVINQHSEVNNIGSMMSLTSIGTDFEV